MFDNSIEFGQCNALLSFLSFHLVHITFGLRLLVFSQQKSGLCVVWDEWRPFLGSLLEFPSTLRYIMERNSSRNQNAWCASVSFKTLILWWSAILEDESFVLKHKKTPLLSSSSLLLLVRPHVELTLHLFNADHMEV